MLSCFTEIDFPKTQITRKLSCRKDDRAISPIYGCPENFRRESLSTPTATFAEILSGFCCDRSYEWAYKI